MHELSIAQNIIDIVFDELHNKNVLKSISINIGALSGVHKDPLIFYLDLILKENKYDKIELKIERSPAKFRCICGKEYCAQDIIEACPVCSEYKRDIIEGKECYIDNIEVKNE